MTAPKPEKLAAGVARQLQETLAELTTTRATLAAVTAERDQARQQLADAPHGDDCRSLEPYVDLRGFPPCDCWKAKL